MTRSPLPIERLRDTDREALATHFLALQGEDRRLRFGTPLGDDALKAYVARIDFVQDGVFAARDFEGRLIAAVHLPVTNHAAELGLSVLAGHRGQGLGGALFARAVTHLQNRGVRSVFVHCLTENEAMMHIARKHRMRVELLGGETNARLLLPPPTANSYMLEWLDDHYARSFESVRVTARLSRAVLGLPI